MNSLKSAFILAICILLIIVFGLFVKEYIIGLINKYLNGRKLSKYIDLADKTCKEKLNKEI